MFIKFPTKEQIIPENEYRQLLMQKAKELNVEDKLIALFLKYDVILRYETDEQEKKRLAKIGSQEVLALLNIQGMVFPDPSELPIVEE